MVEPYPSEKYDIVSWDYDIPNRWKVIKIMFQTTNQRMFEAFGVDEFDENLHRVFDTILGK